MLVFLMILCASTKKLYILESGMLLMHRKVAQKQFPQTFLTLSSLPGVISHNFLFQSLNWYISYSMENLAFDSLLRWKIIELSILTTSLIHLFLNGWENLYPELGSERVKLNLSCLRFVIFCLFDLGYWYTAHTLGKYICSRICQNCLHTALL